MRRDGRPIYNAKYVQLTTSTSIENITSSSSASSNSVMTSSGEFKRHSTNPEIQPTTTTTGTNNNNMIKQRQINLPLLIPDMLEYCITGLYNMDTFMFIKPTLLELMFYESE